MKEINGELIAKGLKVAVVVSRFNSFLTEQLVKGAADAFVRMGGDEKNLTLVRVPGAYEIPVVAQKLAGKQGVDAVLARWCRVRRRTLRSSTARRRWRSPRFRFTRAFRFSTASCRPRISSRPLSVAAPSRATRALR